ncbi:MAG: PQQ-binding-like beta-propeller repeat protein [Armatimonadetes bacterium]|nr:PQQ-binding-like beta-propeller repeat protein [Armatimonadota bacterium]
MKRSSALSATVVSGLALVTLCGCAFGALADSPWPMFRHDLYHSARSQYPAPTPTGTPWKYYIGGSLLSSCAVGTDGTVYVGGSTYLYAINSNGTLKWRSSIGSSTRSSPAIGSDGVIYIGSGNNKLYAFNSNGTQKWAYTTGGGIQSSPAIGPDGTVYCGSSDGYLYALNATGTLKWRRTIGGCAMTSPAVASDGTIYIGGSNQCLNAINPNGTVKWQYQTGANVSSTPAISPDGSRIYVSSLDLNLYCISSAGAKIWNFAIIQLASKTPSSPALGPDGTIYIGSNDNKLFAVNPDGTEKWHYTTGFDVRSSPAVGADGTIYFGAWDGFLYALNPDGTRKWWHLTQGSIFSSPAIDGTGSVVIPSWDGYVYGNLNHNVATTTPPANLQATPLSESSVQLDWIDMSGDEFGFRVEKKVPGGEYMFVTNLAAGTQTYTVTDLQSGQPYLFTVAAYQEGGFAYSNEASAVTLGVRAPSDLEVVAVSGTQIDLNWVDNSSDEIGFKIERKTGNVGVFREIATVAAGATSYSDMSVNPAQDYYYRVRAASPTGQSTYSNEDWDASDGRDYGEIATHSTTRPQMCLTFDAGTQNVRTGILDILRQYGVKCTFFVTGEVAQMTPAFWQIATNDGHQVCNHSWEHPNFTDLTDDLIRKQLRDCDEFVYNLTGNRTRPFFRAPFGARDSRVLQVAAEEGYRHVFWTVDTGDAGWLAPTSEIIQRTLSNAQNGAVILYHCTLETTENSIATVVPTLLAQGYELVTVGELVAPNEIAMPPMPAGWSLMSLPIEPAHPTPPVVMKGVNYDGNLYNWDNETQSLGQYDAMTSAAFGPVSPDYGYWLDSPTEPVLRVSGRLQTTARTIMLPHAYLNPSGAWTIIGYPFLTAQGWGNCEVFNPNAAEPQTRSLAEARDAGWVSSTLYGWDTYTQGLYEIGLDDDWAVYNELEPWHGYWMVTYADDLRLIIPPP